MTAGRQLKSGSEYEDIAIEDGRLVVIDDQASLAQTLVRRLKSVRGAYRYDLSHGVPYFERILGKNIDLQAVRLLYTRALLQHPSVLAVADIEFTVDSQTRVATAKIFVKTQDSALQLNVPVQLETEGE